jgi:dipeptidyl aminopeptidase/acylaminoacyl peptidase
VHARLVFLVVPLAAGCGHRAALVPDSGAGDAAQAPPRADLPPVGACERLAGLGTGGARLTAEHARQALFARSLERALIVTHGDGSRGDLLAVELPSGPASLLASGVGAVEWLASERAVLAQRPLSSKSEAPYELQRVDVPGGAARSLASKVCFHRATPDGSRLYVVRGACSEWLASLELAVVDVASGATTPLAMGARAEGVAVDAASRFTAFAHDVAPKSGCHEKGALSTVDAAGRVVAIATDVDHWSIAFLPSGKLLYTRVDGCSGSGDSYVADPAGGQVVSLGKHAVGGWARESASSRDGATLLGTTREPLAEQLPLLAIPTDGGAPRVLAKDLYPYMTVQAVYQPWALSASGKQVVYVSRPEPKPESAFSSVPLAGGASAAITKRLGSWGGDPASFYRLAPGRDEVAFLTRGSKEKTTVVALSDLPPTRELQLVESSFPISGMSYAPDGGAVLYIEESPGAGAKLFHARTNGKGLTQVGGWTASKLAHRDWPTAQQRYVVDPGSCSVLYDTDVGPEPGTRIALLPR